MKKGMALLILSLSAVLPASATPPTGYTLEWEDNFDGLVLDETKWSHRDLGPRRDGVNVAEAATLTGEGTLKITTSKVGNEYHTGMIGTQGKFERAFGYWEARIKLQDQQGHWSAFWLQSPAMGDPIGNTLVAGTELDIMEYHSNWGEGMQHTMHWDGYGADHRTTKKSVTIAGLKDGFHTFALKWTPEEYVYYVDGIETWRTTTALSHRTQYAILSLEVGTWAGNIANAALPDSMEVDYVRWYAPPPRIIIDTDFRGDCDDVGALAVAHRMMDLGETELIGVVTSSTGPSVVAAIDAVNHYYDRPDIPIGLGAVANTGGSGDDQYAPTLAEPSRYPSDQTNATAPDSTALYRRLLHESPQPVTIVVIGYYNSIAHFMNSPADYQGDGIPHTGMELIQSKVKELVVMGGDFKDPNKEISNAKWDYPATFDLMAHWPTDIIFSGWQIGRAMWTGAGLKNPETKPVAKAYELYRGTTGGAGVIGDRPSYDLAAVIQAVRGEHSDGGRRMWQLSAPGTVTISDSSPYTQYVAHADGRHRYQILDSSDESWLRGVIEELLIAEPAPTPVIENPATVAGRGDVIDPSGTETVDQSFGTPQETLEARSDLRVLQDFTDFTASTTGDNTVRFIDGTLPDMQFQWFGSFNINQAGDGVNDTRFATSGSSHLRQRNSAAGTSTLTITFGTWDGTEFTGNQSVGAAGFTLSQVYTDKSGIVTFRDSTGTAIPGATFSYSGLSNVDASGNHRDIYFGWDSTAQSTAPIGSISITFTDSSSPYSSGLDDFAFTTVTPGPHDTYDTWASNNATTGGPDDDFDGDGVPNAIEFILGGDKDSNNQG